MSKDLGTVKIEDGKPFILTRFVGKQEVWEDYFNYLDDTLILSHLGEHITLGVLRQRLELDRLNRFDDVDGVLNERLTPEERAQNASEVEAEVKLIRASTERGRSRLKRKSMRERFDGQITWDKWIQAAKALLFDCTFSLDSDGLKDEANQLIELGGGYDYHVESSRTPLKWPEEWLARPDTRRGHQVKLWSVYWDAAWDGRKSFEIRLNDRDYKVGDLLIMCEWDPDRSSYTGRQMLREVTYVTDWGQKPGFVVLGVKMLTPNIRESPQEADSSDSNKT